MCNNTKDVQQNRSSEKLDAEKIGLAAAIPSCNVLCMKTPLIDRA